MPKLPAQWTTDASASLTEGAEVYRVGDRVRVTARRSERPTFIQALDLRRRMVRVRSRTHGIPVAHIRKDLTNEARD